jgi:hypothetical protein
MSSKYLRCKNPNCHKIKLAYGDILKNWHTCFCECGGEFEEYLNQNVYSDAVNDFFENVDPKDETRVI